MGKGLFRQCKKCGAYSGTFSLIGRTTNMLKFPRTQELMNAAGASQERFISSEGWAIYKAKTRNGDKTPLLN